MAGHDLCHRVGNRAICRLGVAGGVRLGSDFLCVGNRRCRVNAGVAAGGVCATGKSRFVGIRDAHLRDDCAPPGLLARRVGRRVGLWRDHRVQHLCAAHSAGPFRVEPGPIWLAGLADQRGVSCRRVDGQSLGRAHRTVGDDELGRGPGVVRHGRDAAGQCVQRRVGSVAVAAVLPGGFWAVDELPHQLVAGQ